MSKKIFAVADIHGHYTELMRALDEAGFDRENEEHLFVSCGDLFDRGCENALVYDFVRKLERKVLIRGNHEDMLCEVLACGQTTQRERDNGTNNTIRELIGENAIDGNGCIDVDLYADKIKEITDFADSMADYYEVGRYVFAHGWIPVVFNGRYPTVDPCWREASVADWEYARILEWHQIYEVRALLEGKIIVCGHRPSRLGDMFDKNREPDLSEPFYGDGMIAIDAGTVRSGRVNVLVLDESEW